MHYEGDLQVLENLFRKKRLLRAGDVDHYKYRTLILASSGIMRGVCGGAHAIALDKSGLTNVFDIAVGVSTGAPMLGFFLAGQIRHCLSIYWEEAAGKKFIDFRRLFSRGGPVADTDYLSGVFRQKMDQKRVLCSRTSLYVGATCVHNGEGHLLDAKASAPDPIEAMHASYAMPRLCGRKVRIGDTEYVDGAASNDLPLREAVSRFEPTDILVLANCPRDERTAFYKKVASRPVAWGFSSEFQTAFLNRGKVGEDELRYLRTQSQCRFGIKWTRGTIGSFERNSDRLQAAALLEERDMMDLLATAEARAYSSAEVLAAE